MAQRVDRTPAAALEQHFQHNIAVVVGINRYADVRRLHTAQPDAEYLADLLEDKAGRRDPLDRYHVTSFYDEQASCEQLTTYLTRTLPDEVRKAAGRTRVLFYFAGHGDAEYTDNAIQGYLFPQDAQPREAEESKHNLLPMAEVQKWLAELDCQHVLIILDCCSAGAMARSYVTRSGLLPPPLFWETLQRFVSGKVRQLITSSAYNQKASDVAPGYNIGERDPDENAAHSPFALALFEALAADPLDGGDLRGAGRDGVVTATELHLSISDALYRQVGDAQTPGLWTLNQGHEGGDYIFLLPGAQVQLEPAPDLTGAEHDPWPRSGNEQLAQTLIETSREAAIRELIRRVEVRPLVAVTGRSSAGATSLVSDMLLPRLAVDTAAGSNQGRKAWQVLPPLRLASPAPAQTLADHVSQALGQEAGENAGGATGRLAALVATWAAGHPDRRLLLAVDCAEALFVAAPAEERTRLWALLGEAAQPDVLHVVLTIPKDRWEVPAQADDQDSQPLLPSADRYEVDAIDPFNRDGLRQVIEQLAAARLIIPESETLVTRLLDAVDKQPAALPLLTETLHRMYMRHANSIKSGAKDPRDRTLTQAYYEAEGGVTGVVADLAEQFYCQGTPGCGDTPSGTHQQSVQHVLMRLVAVENGRYVCGSAPLTAFEYPDEGVTARAKTILKEMTALGLAAFGTDAEGQSLVVLGHIALIEAWPRMQRWLVENGAEWDLQRQLAARVAEWQPQQPKPLLWDDDPRLPLVEEMLWPAGDKQRGLPRRIRWAWQVMMPRKEVPADTQWLNKGDATFVHASVRGRARFWRRLTSVTATLLTVLAILTVFALVQRDTAIAKQAQAEMEARRARAGELTSTALQVFNASQPLAMLLGVEGLRAQSTFSETVTGAAQVNMHDLLYQPIGIPLTGHASAISTVTYSSDGHWLVTGSDDGTARLWDRWNPHQEPAILPSRQGSVVAAIFSGDGGWLALGSSDDPQDTQKILPAYLQVRSQDDAVTVATATPDRRILVKGRIGIQIQLWDLHTQDPRPIDLSGFDRDAITMDFSPDGRWFAAGDDNAIIRLWDLNNLEVAPIELIGTGGQVLDLAFNVYTNGLLMVACGEETTVQLWDMVHPNAAPRVLAVAGQPCTMAEFSTDGRWLATANLATAWLWNLQNPKTSPAVLDSHSSNILTMDISPDGRWLGTGSWDTTIRLWNTEHPEIGSVVLVGHIGQVSDVEFSPDSQRLATGSYDGTTMLWDIKNPQAKPTVLRGHEAKVYAVTFDPRGTALATGSADATARVWDLRNLNLDPHLLHGENGKVGWVDHIAYSASGHWLATGSWDGNVQLWEMGDVSVLRRTHSSHKGRVTDVAFSRDESWLATSGWDGTVALWDLHNPGDDPKVLSDHAGSVLNIDFSPDGNWLAISSTDTNIRLRNPRNLQENAIVLAGHKSDVWGLAFSPKGDWLATGSRDNSVRLWDMKDPHFKTAFEQNYEGWVDHVVFSPDGHFLAASNEDRTVRLLDMSSLPNTVTLPTELVGGAWAPTFSHDSRHLAIGSGGKVLLWDLQDLESGPVTTLAHSGTDMAFSPDDRLLASGGDDYVYVWDISNSQAVANTIVGRSTSAITDLEFSPNGCCLAAAGRNAFVQLWTLRIDSLDALACGSAGRNLTSEEWQRYFSLDPYRRTCSQWPAHPSVIQAITAEAKKLASEDNLKSAVDRLRQAQALDPRLQFDPIIQARRLAAEAAIEKATSLAKRGEVAEAILLFERANDMNPELQLNPNEAAKNAAIGGAFDRASRFEEAGDYEQAIKAYDEVIRVDSSNADAYADRCFARYTTGDVQGAIGDCTSAININPGYAWAYEVRGYANDAFGAYDLAIEDYSATIALGGADYNLRHAYANRGWVYYKTERYQKAVNDLLMAISLYPEYVWAYEFLGRSYADLGYSEKAIQSLTKAIELKDPDYDLTDAYVYRGWVYYEMESYEKAVDDLLMAISLSPEYVWAYDFLGRSYSFLTRHEEAVQSLTKAIALDDRDYDYKWTLWFRSASHFALRQDELALGDLRTATAKDPKFVQAWGDLCWYGALAGRVHQVLDACETAVRLTPQNGNRRDSRGLARALTGDVPGAIKDFEFAVAQAKKEGQSDDFISSRTAWVEALHAGENPFDAATLERLRNE